MAKLFAGILTLLFVTLAGSGVANAATLSFEDVYNPNDIFFSRSGLRSLEFTHDLSSDGFDPLTDTLTDATLSLYLWDDGDPSAEKVDIALDDLWSFNNETISSGTGSTRFTVNVSVLVAADGTLNVSLTRQNGTFYFDRSVLNAEGIRDDTLTPTPEAVSAVPEPASGALLGFGLVVFAARRWRQRNA